MASTGSRRRPQKYPDELRERAVRMVFEIREQTGESHGVVARVARELGVGVESLRGWVNQAEVGSATTRCTGAASSPRPPTAPATTSAATRSPGSCASSTSEVPAGPASGSPPTPIRRTPGRPTL